MEIKQFLEAVNFLRKEVDKELVANQMGTLLAVMDREGITIPEVAEYLDIPPSTVARSVKILSRYQVKSHVEGFDLIFAEPALENRRRYALSLTIKGRELKSKLEKVLEEGGC